jgi:tagatose-1,6-bisphosphate aldolase
LRACATDRGTFAILALDHRQNLRRMLDPVYPEAVPGEKLAEFKGAAVRQLGAHASGLLLDPEYGLDAVRDRPNPAHVGLLLALEATDYEGEGTDRRSRLLDGWSVAQAKAAGAAAAKLLLYYQPDAPGAAAQERLLSDVAAQCRAADLALFVEALTFSTAGAPLAGEGRRRAVAETARRLSRIGGDVLKAEFPYGADVADEGKWADACAEMTSASALPWVLLSGGVEHDTFVRQAAVACRAGASGVVAGRAVWGEAVPLGPSERDRFLAEIGVPRLKTLVDVARELGRPWRGPD